MCEYCEKNKTYYDEHMSKANITFEYGYPCLEVGSDGYWTDIEIRYCPWCKRDLKG